MHIQHSLIVGQLHLRKTLIAQNAGVVDDDIQFAKAVQCRLHNASRCLWVRYRGIVGHSMTASAANFGNDSVCGRLVAATAVDATARVVDDHFGALLGQQ